MQGPRSARASTRSIATERVRADRRWFVISDDNWAEFEALERPVVYKPRLEALLDEHSPFAKWLGRK